MSNPKIGELCWFWDSEDDFKKLGILCGTNADSSDEPHSICQSYNVGYDLEGFNFCKPAREDFDDYMFGGKNYNENKRIVMGTDINVFVEKYIDDEWVMVRDSGSFCNFSSRAGERNYYRFDYLAQVRPGECKDKKTHPKNGFPSDLSKGVYWHWEMYGEHTPCWRSLKDAIKQWAITSDDENYLKHRDDIFICEYFFNISPNEEEFNDYRIIFWFDS